MHRLLFSAALAALLAGPSIADAQSSGGGCGIAGYPCYSRQLGNPTTPSDRSGSIILGGTAQQLMAANPSRNGCALQNLSTGDLWVSAIGTASAGAGSWWVPAGSYWECPMSGVTTSAISIYGATTGQVFTAREW